tara:strand:- start:167 stop:619 length:453 start_codon:yes stop_codon:yes gene_type:complete
MPAHEVTKMISEILGEFEKAKSRQAKKEVLEKYKNVEALRYLLCGTFDPKIQWAITEQPDYSEDDITPEGEEANSLYIEMPKSILFIKGHPAGARVRPERLKQILIQILESLHPSESKLYMQMLKKKSKIKGLTSKLVLEVFPNMYKEGG